MDIYYFVALHCTPSSVVMSLISCGLYICEEYINCYLIKEMHA